MTTTAGDIIHQFSALYKTTPQVFFSPGRINLIGEHIDYNDGFVMPAAVDKGIWLAAAANNTDRINIYSFDMNESLGLSLPEVKKMDGWRNYVLGVINELQVRGYNIGGFDCVFGGNIPVGAGLSSSAAVECGIGFALSTIFNLGINPVEIALIGQKAEHTFPGVQCGIMDQFANMMGLKNHVLLLDCTRLSYESIPLQLDNYSIILINSKVHHSLASGEYNVRRKECETGFGILKQHYPTVQTFRDVQPQQVLAVKDSFEEKIFDRCLYVTQEIERTQNAALLLKENKLTAFGRLMFESHDGLSNLYDVSCEELDFLVAHAKLHPEIIGCRMMGGGFGGCTINLVEKEKADEILLNITSAYREQFGITAEIYSIKISDGTHVWAL